MPDIMFVIVGPVIIAIYIIMKNKYYSACHASSSHLIVLLLLFACCGLNAQIKDYNFRFSARIIAADTSVYISNCHIMNMNQNLGTLSDTDGYFWITANVGDSIMFSFLGYERLTIATHDSLYANNSVISLKPSAFVLTELDIGLLSTYDRFKRDILSREAEEALRLSPLISKYDIYIPPLPNQGGVNIPLIGALASPVTFFYDLLSKEGKQNRYYRSVINGTAEFIILGEKFNGLLVKQLTGFENDELIKFMSFCKFTKEYLLASTDMEIQREIMRKYRNYIIIQ